ncbi:lecithin retinol acyltransferase family protein [Ureibacillus sp. GCM10028918]|uniref:lecithin retinol acyltransferase family protein n=1 Tax=Ureibacillus sp. GCM10028918 TaxID=3273429 RepID=UPI00361716F2
MSLFGLMFSNKKVRNAIQEKVEEVAYNVNPNVGDLVNKGNKIHNKAIETQERFGQTLRNGLDSKGLAPYLRRYLGKDADDLQIGDHLWVQRFQYTHHGIYYGDGQVIHYLIEGVTVDSLETFADGSIVRRKNAYQSPTNYSPNEIITRAQSRLGEYSYNLVFNNCEHFCRWCRKGD